MWHQFKNILEVAHWIIVITSRYIYFQRNALRQTCLGMPDEYLKIAESDNAEP